MNGQCLTVTVETENEHFRQYVSTIASALDVVADSLGVPPITVSAVLAADFRAAVESASTRANLPSGQPFTVERIGGQVAAKNIPLQRDGSEVEIVFDASLWPSAPEGMELAKLVFLVAHELTHPILDRLRHASGAKEGVPFPSITPVECARSMTKSAVDELRCDLIADLVLRQMIQATTDDGQRHEIRLGDVHNGGFIVGLVDAVAAHVHPGWPDAVEDYRNHRISLDEMWSRVVTQTDQTLTLLAHAQAEAMTLDLPRVFVDTLETHPGVTLYLEPMWKLVVEAFDGLGLIPTLDDFAEMDRRVGDAGERALLEMWEKLGMTVEIRHDRSYALWISEPAR